MRANNRFGRFNSYIAERVSYALAPENGLYDV